MKMKISPILLRKSGLFIYGSSCRLRNDIHNVGEDVGWREVAVVVHIQIHYGLWITQDYSWKEDALDIWNEYSGSWTYSSVD